MKRFNNLLKFSLKAIYINGDMKVIGCSNEDGYSFEIDEIGGKNVLRQVPIKLHSKYLLEKGKTTFELTKFGQDGKPVEEYTEFIFFPEGENFGKRINISKEIMDEDINKEIDQASLEETQYLILKSLSCINELVPTLVHGVIR